ncbi:MAG: hypothetical protein ABW072_11745 [Sedimenticola sp.]
MGNKNPNDIDQENFQPFLWALTQLSVPSPIFAVAYTGIKRWLYTDLPVGIKDQNNENQFEIVRSSILKKHRELPGSPFGKHLGYIFLQSPDMFYEFDTDGNYIAPFNKPIPHMTANVKVRFENDDE